MDEELAFDNAGARLRGTLSLPAGPGPFPVVVVAHGAQAGSRDYFLYRHLTHLLEAHGIGTFRFDRRGEGASTGETGASFRQLGADVAAAVRTAGGHPGVDPARVALWGISQGGWITILAAASGARVRGLAIVSGTPVTPARQMTHAATAILRARGFDDAVVERALALRKTVERFAKAELPAEDVRPLVDEASAEPWFPDAWIPDLDEADWTDMDLDVVSLLPQIEVPILLFFGALDPWIPVQESLAIWKAAAPSDLTVEVLAGVGHELVPADPLSIPAAGAPAPQYERTLTTWARRILDVPDRASRPAEDPQAP